MDTAGILTGASIFGQTKKEKPLGDGTVKYDQPFIVFSDFDGYLKFVAYTVLNADKVKDDNATG